MEFGRQPTWLHAAFFASSAVTMVVVGAAIANEARRKGPLEQRIVPALGVVDRCETCHDSTRHPGAWLSTHPTERYGCTPCHAGQGLATTRSDAHEAKMDWERPLFSPLERAAACGRCHLGEGAVQVPMLAAGRTAVMERGCTGCHEIPGFAAPAIGPELDGLRRKVGRGWLRAWLLSSELYPKRLMPRFRLDATQVEALESFLWSLDGPGIQPAPAGLTGDAERGKLAVAARRCATCHEIEGRGGTFAITLDAAGAKMDRDWLFAYLTDPHRLRPRTRMPGFRIPAQEAADIVAYAAEQWVPDTPELPWARYDIAGAPRSESQSAGRKLFSELGCRGCHEVASVPPTRAGVSLAGIGERRSVDLLRSASLAPARDVPSWIADKLLHPTAFDKPGLRASQMPAYEIDAGEAVAIGVAVAAARAAEPPAAYVQRSPASPPPVPAGATGALVERFRCLVCHRVGGVGGDVSRVPLDGVSSRVARRWLEEFLQAPVTVRMDQAERMPVLGIEPAEAKRLANWIESSLADDRLAAVAPLTNEEAVAGKALYAERRCADCHVAEGQGTMKGPVLDGARERLTAEYAVALLQVGARVVPAGRHPEGVLSASESRALAAYVMSLPPPAAPAAPVEARR
jgi:mono/diheme cytochrome c family protein